MADEVDIIGLGNLPPWASEKTLADLADSIKTLTGLSKDQKKVMQDTFREMQKTGKVTADNARKVAGAAAGGAGGAVGVTAALTSGLKEAGTKAVDTAAGFDKLGGPLKGFGKALKDSSMAFKGTLAVVGLLGNAVGKYIATVRESVGVLRGLSDSGVQFKGSFVEVSAALADTGLTLEAFGGIADKYARVMGQNGLDGLIGLTKATERAAGSFSTFGLTTAEATEYAAEYLDQQRLAGVFGKATQVGQSAALKENMERLTAYSKVLNVSRKDLQDASREMLSNADLQAELFSMDKDQRVKAQAAFAKTAQAFAAMGPAGLEMGKIFTDIAASPVAEASDGFQQLANAGLADLANRMVKLAEANKNGEGATLDQLLAMAELTDAEKEQLAALRLAGGEIKNMAVTASAWGQSADEARISQAEMTEAAAKANMSVEDYAKTVDKNVAAASKLDDAMQKFQATTEYGMVKSFATLLGGKGTEAVHMMADGLNELTGKLRGFIDGPMVQGIEDFKEGALKVWGVKEVMADMGNVINDWIIKPFKAVGAFINEIIQGIMVGWDKFVALIDRIPGVDFASDVPAGEIRSTAEGARSVQYLTNPEQRARIAEREMSANISEGGDPEVTAILREIMIAAQTSAKAAKKDSGMFSET